ncbi:hypothetical protein BUALT_Bualt02G0010900 [Buddleja alternifolia]|uniref:Uncharacterized protein n=1 Tax=Buddleja alternifolia TaxID=168488 RepID=A0AAV6XWD0_9LAMI|nr:hypothetical protein BUALT_Bualt02G0010900 [Buddleja alternifolia]
MEVSTRQNDVLKVVHPGRHVEFFREPITADEIMKKYPRHCIARPDFFEFPWIFVHPASVLVPGKVFYLVPYRAVDNLLKAKKHSNLNDQEESYYDEINSEPGSPFDDSGARVARPEDEKLLRIKPCLKKANSVGKKVDIKVSFASPVAAQGRRAPE